jgi:hypothetical protein
MSYETPQAAPESLMLLNIEIQYIPEGHWHTIAINREELKNIMFTELFEDRPISAVCFATVEDDSCALRMIYSFDSDDHWRFE